MTLSDVLAALRALTPAERLEVRLTLHEMIAADNKAAYRERSCAVYGHPKHRIHERRRGDKSIDLVCGRCGEVVEFIE